MENKHILVVEDEAHLAKGIQFNLEAEGYRATTVGDGASALKICGNPDETIDLVILDLMLPGMSGYAVCDTLRASGNDVPVLMLSARTLTEDRARGFEVGANQYLAKPFELVELLSRVKNLLTFAVRRKELEHRDADVRWFEFTGVKIDFATHRVDVRGQPLRLTNLEFKLLQYFIKNEGRVIARNELLEKVWQLPGNLSTRAPDQFIRRLRKYFELDPANPKHFLTIRDVGYRFVAEKFEED